MRSQPFFLARRPAARPFIAPDRGFRQRIGYAKDIKLQARAETLDRLDGQRPSCMTIV